MDLDLATFDALNQAVIDHGTACIRSYYDIADAEQKQRLIFEMTAVPPYPHLSALEATNANKFRAFINREMQNLFLDRTVGEEKRAVAMMYLATFDQKKHGVTFLVARRNLFKALESVLTPKVIEAYLSSRGVTPYRLPA
jgi:hypothetical protein